VTPDPGPDFHKFLTPVPGPKEKRRILPESTPVIRIRPHLWCTGAGVSEWTPAGVLTIFENRSGPRVDFFKEGPEPEWSQSQFFNKRLLCLLLICKLFFTKHVIT